MDVGQRNALDSCLEEFASSVDGSAFFVYLTQHNILGGKQDAFVRAKTHGRLAIVDTVNRLKENEEAWDCLIGYLRENKHDHLAEKLVRIAKKPADHQRSIGVSNAIGSLEPIVEKSSPPLSVEIHESASGSEASTLMPSFSNRLEKETLSAVLPDLITLMTNKWNDVQLQRNCGMLIDQCHLQFRTLEQTVKQSLVKVLLSGVICHCHDSAIVTESCNLMMKMNVQSNEVHWYMEAVIVLLEVSSDDSVTATARTSTLGLLLAVINKADGEQKDLIRQMSFAKICQSARMLIENADYERGVEICWKLLHRMYSDVSTDVKIELVESGVAELFCQCYKRFHLQYNIVFYMLLLMAALANEASICQDLMTSDVLESLWEIWRKGELGWLKAKWVALFTDILSRSLASWPSESVTREDIVVALETASKEETNEAQEKLSRVVTPTVLVPTEYYMFPDETKVSVSVSCFKPTRNMAFPGPSNISGELATPPHIHLQNKRFNLAQSNATSGYCSMTLETEENRILQDVIPQELAQDWHGLAHKIAQHYHTHLFVHTPSGCSKHVADVWIPLKLTAEHCDYYDTFDQKRVLEVLSSTSNPVVIEGVSGSGKSTLMKHIVYEWSCDVLSRSGTNELLLSLLLSAEFFHVNAITAASVTEYIALMLPLTSKERATLLDMVNSLGERLLLCFDGSDVSPLQNTLTNLTCQSDFSATPSLIFAVTSGRYLHKYPGNVLIFTVAPLEKSSMRPLVERYCSTEEQCETALSIIEKYPNIYRYPLHILIACQLAE